MHTALLASLVLAQIYWPGAQWQQRTPAQVKLNAAKLDEAIAFAKANENPESRNLDHAHYLGATGREPFSENIGPFKLRGDQTGVIIRNGYIVAEWGEPTRVDNTFSVTKSFVSTVVGLAVDRKMIALGDRVADSVPPVYLLGDRLDGKGQLVELFDSPHAKSITWEHMLRQTSDWQGTLWGKPDWADRPAQDLAAELKRERHAPGTVYEYNDTRVNLLALAALNVWRRPLPQVLREHVMDPIGASSTWRWYGYDNSWVLIDGEAMQSVSGGAHWGGGLIINARDMARFGLLTLRRGRWNDRQILSEGWIRNATTPTGAQSDYGFMNYFLNTDRKLLPSAPAEAFMHVGAGQNAIYVDPRNDLVIVLRWIRGSAVDGVVARVLAAIE
jgi:CubicO group peptidase (beta-lactamase class C family)